MGAPTLGHTVRAISWHPPSLATLISALAVLGLNDSPILPGSNALGVDNLTTMLTSLLTAGKLTQADYDRQAITWTSATIRPERR